MRLEDKRSTAPVVNRRPRLILVRGELPELTHTLTEAGGALPWAWLALLGATALSVLTAFESRRSPAR